MRFKAPGRVFPHLWHHLLTLSCGEHDDRVGDRRIVGIEGDRAKGPMDFQRIDREFTQIAE